MTRNRLGTEQSRLYSAIRDGVMVVASWMMAWSVVDLDGLSAGSSVVPNSSGSNCGRLDVSRAFPLDNCTELFILELRLVQSQQSPNTKKCSKGPAFLNSLSVFVFTERRNKPAVIPRLGIQAEHPDQTAIALPALSPPASSASVTYPISLYPSYESRR
jgi:hypothetical protein